MVTKFHVASFKLMIRHYCAIIFTLCLCTAIFGVPQPKVEREDKEPELTKICEKSPVKELLEGKIPWEGDTSGIKCENQLAQLQARKKAIRNALECAKAKLKRFKLDIEKVRAELDGFLNSNAYKEMSGLERESIRCNKCTALKCPRSNDFCGGITPPRPPIPPHPLLDIGDIGIGGCGMETDFHQGCAGGGIGRGLRGLIGKLQPPNCEECRPILCCKKDDMACIDRLLNGHPCQAQCSGTIKCDDNPTPPVTCCEKVYAKCTENGWTTGVESCENIPQPQSSKNSILQKLQEIKLLLLHGRCPDVIQKLPDLINEVKDKAKIPTIPPPSYGELCKDIKVDDSELEKIEICREATKKCQPECTKKEGDKETLDMECFKKCVSAMGCEPDDVVEPKCTKNDDCAKTTCPEPDCLGETCPKLEPVCEGGKCICKPVSGDNNNCTDSLKKTCSLIAAPCMPDFCKPCFPESVCSRIVSSLDR